MYTMHYTQTYITQTYTKKLYKSIWCILHKQLLYKNERKIFLKYFIYRNIKLKMHYYYRSKMLFGRKQSLQRMKAEICFSQQWLVFLLNYSSIMILICNNNNTSINLCWNNYHYCCYSFLWFWIQNITDIKNLYFGNKTKNFFILILFIDFFMKFK